MTLAPGARIGPYEILTPIGLGGMGEVYRAQDTKLKRDVALKILPEEFSKDADRLARFQREAEALAALNHPHIAQVYGLEESPSTGTGQAGPRAIVMELVEGDDLTERIARGPVPVIEALTMGRQIAEALEAAHDAGIVHRDLKPANIKVTPDGTVKVLDFGLAKAGFGPQASSPKPQDDSPTITSPAVTRVGVVLGTAAYMSPEQARGKAVDRRTDIWAFGCVLYELLTGQRAFGGETLTDTLAAVVEREPDSSALPPATPASIRTLLRRCLEKDVKQRLPHIGAARLEIVEALARSGASPEQAATTRADMVSNRWRTLAVAAAVVALALAGTVWSGRLSPPSAADDRAVVRLDLGIPVDRIARTAPINRGMAVSPDGTRLVYVSGNQLYVRAIDSTASTPLAGTEGVGLAQHPVFSPDGAWVAFHRHGALQKVALAGGPPATICALDLWGGGSWGADGTIVFAQADGLYRVPSAGGTPTRLLALEDPEHEQVRQPQFLVGGALLYTHSTDPLWSAARVVVQRPGEAVTRTILERVTAARFVPDGYLMFDRDGALYAVAFDADRLIVSGDPVRLAEGISTVTGPTVGLTMLGQRQLHAGAAAFAVSNDVLLYAPTPEGSTLVWVDRQGRISAIGDPVDVPYHTVRISPDGRRVVADGVSPRRGAWVHDLERQTRTALVQPPALVNVPAWSRDGLRVMFSRSVSGVLEKSADGTGDERQVFDGRGADFNEASWSPDGREVVVTTSAPSNPGNIVVVSPGGSPRTLVATPADERAPRFSPDGRWLAYQSDETGRPEIYVQPYPGPGGRVLVSTHGGTAPVWAHGGSELFYHQDTALMAVPVRTGSTFTAGTPTRLFDAPVKVDFNGHPAYDVAPDGQRFLMIQDTPVTRLKVVLNWRALMKPSATTQ